MYSIRLVLFGLVYFTLIVGTSSSLLGQIKVVADNSVRVGPSPSSSAKFGIDNTQKNYGLYLRNSFDAGVNTQYGLYHLHSAQGVGDKYGILNNVYQNEVSTGLIRGISNHVHMSGDNEGSGISAGLYNTTNCNYITRGVRYGLFNYIIGDGSGRRSALYNYVRSSTTDPVYGLENRVDASNSSVITGIYNYIYSSNTSSSNNKYGIFNVMIANASTKNYGEYIHLQNANTSATNVGLYSNVGANQNWAGYFNGNVRVIGEIDCMSDEKTKEDIQDIKAGIISVKKLRPRKYKSKEGSTKKDGKKRQKYGFLAQEVETVFPDMVTTASVPGNPILETRKDEEGNVTEEIVGYEKEEELKSLNYSALIPILTKAIQEQQEQIDLLTKQVDVMQKEITELKKRLK